ncbi:phosphonate metabolism protein/1,5-bisphosphokinase (PRPP-forming) PhnN [Paracoccus sp. 08]|uniref:phosphonate metabolism protein/1,5-bisphosphokinase (PRPP-forming) PhnN n=1 Tax=Paracoccus sp. 08 TaxID=2606624 RepID=UPI00209447C8|nr:phosphonate metabolism protein/1,5-bisphosphokinase (PRPP-forming) PhnN [Paracoccus sp. 08]MCO6363272.1 phosphonate metabolism protein/1,5-bisphosphokinase (PRPP-forming) PhnN [Paracoccus sp. 08]
MIAAVVGPSGAGKDTLIAAACAARPDLRLARRVITRPSDAGGEDFDGVTPARFAALRDGGHFALDWRAHGLCYGIPHDQLTGPSVIFNGSRLPDLRVILITAPAEVLARRLADRGREGSADIAARLRRAAFAMPPGIAHLTVCNDACLAQGTARLLAALQPDRGAR